jgi:hypothetical protein
MKLTPKDHRRISQYFREMGHKGGLSAAAKLSPEQRSARAALASAATRRSKKQEAA